MTRDNRSVHACVGGPQAESKITLTLITNYFSCTVCTI